MQRPAGGRAVDQTREAAVLRVDLRGVAAVDGGREPRRAVYRRAGLPCPRCRSPVRSGGLGEANRTAYWCPSCQPGGRPPG